MRIARAAMARTALAFTVPSQCRAGMGRGGADRRGGLAQRGPIRRKQFVRIQPVKLANGRFPKLRARNSAIMSCSTVYGSWSGSCRQEMMNRSGPSTCHSTRPPRCPARFPKPKSNKARMRVHSVAWIPSPQLCRCRESACQPPTAFPDRGEGIVIDRLVLRDVELNFVSSSPGVLCGGERTDPDT
jgi:hypothetical protein